MKVDASLVALGAGFLIPLLTAFVTKPTANAWLKSAIAVVLAGVSAVGAKVADVHGAVNVKQLAAVGALALVAAGGARLSTLLGTIEDWLSAKTAKWGLG